MRNIAAVIAVLSLPLASSAQDPQPLEAGTRLRIVGTGTPAQVRTGELHALSDGGRVLLVERSEGRRRNVGAAIAGAVLGAAVGGVTACHFNRDSYGVFCAGQSDTKIVIGSLIGAAVGATIGAVLFQREERAPVETNGLRPGAVELTVEAAAAGAPPQAGAAAGSEATQSVLHGRVIDAVSRIGISGAQVSVVGTTVGTLSDSLGAFRLPWRFGDTVTVQVQQIGRRRTTFTVPGTAVRRRGADYEVEVPLLRQAPRSEPRFIGAADPAIPSR